MWGGLGSLQVAREPCLVHKERWLPMTNWDRGNSLLPQVNAFHPVRRKRLNQRPASP